MRTQFQQPAENGRSTRRQDRTFVGGGNYPNERRGVKSLSTLRRMALDGAGRWPQRYASPHERRPC